MAIDSWLLEQHRLGLYPPTLRFYTWSPIAISLGYHQKSYPDHWQHLSWQGQAIDLVRRPSGGRAVLHQGDLTYAVILSGLSGTRLQAYQAICQFLIEGWRSLGVELSYGTAGRGYIHHPNCFGTATGADLVTETGVKLIGSAQLRRGSAILQHGSIRLTTDPRLYYKVFGVDLDRLILPGPLGADPIDRSIDCIIQALQVALQAQWSIQLVTQPFSEAERQAALANISLD